VWGKKITEGKVEECWPTGYTPGEWQESGKGIEGELFREGSQGSE